MAERRKRRRSGLRRDRSEEGNPRRREREATLGWHGHNITPQKQMREEREDERRAVDLAERLSVGL